MRRTVSIGALAGMIVLAGCGGGGNAIDVPAKAPSVPSTIALSSPDFPPGGTIPKQFTCSGRGDPPTLRWTHAPADTRSFALTVEDPDAPSGTFVHWMTWDIPATSTTLPSGVTPPRQGNNSSGKPSWTPPCPPPGKPHRYVFTLYALRSGLGEPNGAFPSEVRNAIAKEAQAKGTLTGTFGR